MKCVISYASQCPIPLRIFLTYMQVNNCSFQTQETGVTILLSNSPEQPIFLYVSVLTLQVEGGFTITVILVTSLPFLVFCTL